MASATGGWQAAVEIFISYLPPDVRRWIVLLEPPLHHRIFEEISSSIVVNRLFLAGQADPRAVHEAAEDAADQDDVGYLEFVVTDGRFDHGGVDYREAVRPFAGWDNSRVRLCFDVWDGVFPALFSEPRADLVRRAREMQARVGEVRALSVESNGGGRLGWDCATGPWTRCDGESTSDYLLPVGEIACRPSGLEGELPVDGWVIGSIPFGLKYGRIKPGALRLTFRSGEVAEVGGNDVELCRDIEVVMERIPELRLVSEAGLGLSGAATKASELVAAGMQWHERRVGVHVGLGAELPETIVQREHLTSHHLDIVLAGGTLTDQAGDVVLSW